MAFHRKFFGFTLPMKHSETLGTDWNVVKPIETDLKQVGTEFGFSLFQRCFNETLLERHETLFWFQKHS